MKLIDDIVFFLEDDGGFAATSTLIAIAGLAIAAGGAVMSIKAQQEAASQQKKLNNVNARRDRRRAIRESRMARAQVLNTGAQVGAGESSAVSGGVSSVGAQMGSNLGFSTQTQALGNNITNANARDSMFQGISSIGSSIFSASGGFGGAGAAPAATQPSAVGGTGFAPRTGGGFGQPGRPF